MLDRFFVTVTDVNLLSFSSGAHFRHREEDVGGFRHKGLHRQPWPWRLPRHEAGEHRCLRRSCAPALQTDDQTDMKINVLYEEPNLAL